MAALATQSVAAGGAVTVTYSQVTGVTVGAFSSAPALTGVTFGT